MSRIKAFLLGAGIGAAGAFFVADRLSLSVDEEDAGSWRVRAEMAESRAAVSRARADAAEGELARIRTQLASHALEQPALPPGSAALPVPGPASVHHHPWPEVKSSSAKESLPPLDADLNLDEVGREEWNALVSSTLEREVSQRLGRTLSPERLERLTDNLARLRDASLGLRSENPVPGDPASLSDHLARTLMLVESDRIFRSETGIGISDFLQGLNGSQIEEVSTTEPVESNR